jgi:hypothetical protein
MTVRGLDTLIAGYLLLSAVSAVRHQRLARG